MSRAQSLRKETALNSITPERVGGIMYDTAALFNQQQLLGTSPLVISKIYESAEAMEADANPVSDLTGEPLKPGQIVCIVTGDPDDPEDGLVYRYDGTEDDTSSWTAVGKIGSDPYLEGFQYMGKAVLTPTPTDPGVPTQKVFYQATEPGAYTNFGGIIVADGEVVNLKWDGTDWSKEVTGAASAENLDEVRTAISKFDYAQLTPTQDVAGKFIHTDGSERSNANCGYYKFAVTGGGLYAFSGKFSGGYNIYYLYAFDSNGDFIGQVGNFPTASTAYNKQLVTAPANAAVITLNYQNSYKSDSALFDVDAALIQSADCLRAIGPLPAIDLNDVQETGCWILVGENYSNLPSESKYGYLRVTRLGPYVFQEFISQNGGNVYKRKFQYTGANMEVWQLVGADATMRGSLPSGDLNDVLQTGTWILVDSNTYTNAPDNATLGFLRVSVVRSNWVLQEFFAFVGANYYKRKINVGQTPEAWVQVGGTETINNYYNTYEVTATPTITTDTNQFLAATGDTTDRTLDILTMLQTAGVCRLGPGDFYVDGVEMPDNTQIIGSGPTTKVYLIVGANKFAIKMGKHCAVKNFALIGASSHTPASTVGTRHGILWKGNYSETEASAQQPNQGIVDAMWISNFAGGGITCTDTGYATGNAIECTNCWITSCDAGINISYWSEFHKFTNIRTNGCYYGCINNGGNNVFVNCDFSSCKEGFLMDNSQSQSPNNSHGSAMGCVFNHSNSNAGVGIRILGCSNGFVFVGCQIFFSQTVIENSSGVTFSACNYGNVNCNISVNGGGAVLFIGNMHQEAPTINITDNDHVVFANCYVRSTGAVVSGQ